MVTDKLQVVSGTEVTSLELPRQRQGALPGFLAGLQAEWFDRTELEWQDRSARPRIETSRQEPAKVAHALLVQCHVDLQDVHDVRSAKLQAGMKSAKPTHLTCELERTIIQMTRHMVGDHNWQLIDDRSASHTSA